MKSDKIDKIISILFLVLSAGVIIWWFMIAFSNAETEQNVFTLFTFFSNSNKDSVEDSSSFSDSFFLSFLIDKTFFPDFPEERAE